MHRSGTSCLAGSLEQQGLFLGEVTTKGPFNKRGNRESFDMMKLQGKILEQSGGRWDDPPSVVDWKPEHFETASRMLAEHSERPNWGFKDPRTVLTIDGWRELVPDLQPVGIFRHPLAVAKSLEQRNKFPTDKSLGLWEIYNRRLVELHREDPFPVVSFDEDAGVLQGKLVRAGEMIGLETTAVDDPFFTDELRTSLAEGEPLPPAIAELYEDLRARAI
jgi:hypothetical protein